MVCFGNEQRSLSFVRLHRSTAFWTLVDCDSISSEGFLLTIVDIIIWIKFAHSSPFYSLGPRISMFTLALSCLTTSNLPWFMDLTFQVPMQYCSLQHRTLVLSPVTSTTGHCFRCDFNSSFFLELFLYPSPAAYWTPTDLGSSSFSVLSFCLFILFMGFSRQNTELVYHSLLQWTMFCQVYDLVFHLFLLLVYWVFLFFFLNVLSIFMYFAFFPNEWLCE